MARPGKTVFLARHSYRRRRLRDAAQLLPVLGTILWMIPLLWPQGPLTWQRNSMALLYIFGVWIGLIILAAVLSRLLGGDDEAETESDA